MSHHSTRGARRLVPASFRWLSLSVLALGGALLAPSAQAAAEPQTEEGPVATITHLSVEQGAFKVGIRWSDKQALPASAKLLSQDGAGNTNDGAEVTPKPGEESFVTLGKAIQKPWETGWNQRLVLQGAKEEALATFPYNVNLDCTDDKNCTLNVSAGAATNAEVVHVSTELDALITELQESRGETEFDLVEEVGKANPRLLGEALVYVHTLAKLRPLSGPCTCVWQAVYAQSPASIGYGVNVSNANGILSGWNGPGAKHALTAIGGSPAGIGGTFNGISQVTLKLNCTRWVYYYYWDVVIGWPGHPVIVLPFPRPRLVPCISTCAVRFDHQGRISGSTFVAYTSPGSSASAREQATYRVDGVPLMSLVANNGTAFNQATGTTVWSNIGSTGRVDSSGNVFAAKSFPYFSSASVANGHAISIHGQAKCPWGPNGHAAVWTYGTSQGIPQTNVLRQSIQNFFWQWGIFVIP
ncbi:hypothetical protein [Myxococcus landrumensis]|uniref:Uncharacterized protein n=1 Tax=Myxococcus landrumensis TaxID=2813577 RepID=A0ABX7N9T2_9BACT|nr:hypothetical protein [Myxococcus landrumus]QSQ13103.1 hypothetical protein JY572_32890 [Myxococcus landrumus]